MSLLYVAFALAVFLFERRRTHGSRVDAITIFVVLFFLQCCLPGIMIYATLPFVDTVEPTGNEAFDNIFRATDFTTALLVLILTIWFAIFFYVGCAVGRLALGRRPALTSLLPARSLTVMDGRLLLLLAAGLGVTLWSFYLMGDSLVSRYTNLILFRAGFEGIERNTLNANAFALTQSWSWLSVVAVFAINERRGKGILWIASVALVVIFALLGVSRRALFLPVLLAFLTLVLYSGKWRAGWLLVGSIPVLLIVAFGKELLAAAARGAPLEAVTGSYQSVASALLRPMADMGITIVESLGTLKFLHLDLRYGIDHVLSIAQRFPKGTLGIELNFPERIVRISTAAIADPNAQDIPPGLLGQMWLDFGILGPVVWGLVFGFQMSFLTYLFERIQRSWQSTAVLVLLVFLVALPLNSGSFDFSFSWDIFAVLLGLLWCVRVRRRSVNAPAVAPVVEVAH